MPLPPWQRSSADAWAAGDGKAFASTFTPDTAVVITIGMRPVAPGVHTDDRSIQTRVAVRTKGTWLFTNFHNTHIRELAA